MTRRTWMLAFGGAGALIAVLHLVGLSTAPPGLYNDEASIGYNAWAIAHHGVDEHGAAFPLYFEAFGEWKNPVYIYLLAPFTWVLPLTPYVERLPAALCGLAICVVVALLAFRVTGSRTVALAALLTAGFTPWLVLETRVGFEVVTMTLALTVALWCLAGATRVEKGRGWALGGGVALAVALYAYSTGRLFVAMLAVIIIAVDWRRWTRTSGLWPALIPLVPAYALLGIWSLRHPGALTDRFNALSIASDHPGAVTVVGRFVSNYIAYFGFPFLATHGDANPRHSTGFGGMLLVTVLPVMLLGVVAAWRRRHAPLERIALLGLVAAPLPAALTGEGTPHALRGAGMVPFLLLFAVWGWQEVLPLLASRRVLAVAAGIAVLVEVGGFMTDLYVDYPARALTAFDSGELDAVTRAHTLAGAHHVYLSTSLDAPYIQALFALRPDPRDYDREGLDAVGMSVVSPADMDRAATGDVLVLDPRDPPPAGAQPLFTESVTVTDTYFEAGAAGRYVVTLVSAYRR